MFCGNTVDATATFTLEGLEDPGLETILIDLTVEYWCC
jgi:hypothetical protein